MNTFVYYYDIINEDCYIGRTEYELYKKLNLDTPVEARIIEGRNTYKITKKALSDLIDKENLRPVENIVELEYKKKPNNTIIVYEDDETHDLYIPEEYAKDTKTEKKEIMNRTCYKVLDKSILNDNTVVVKVYLSENNKEEIIVCDLKNQYFIKKELVEKYLDDIKRTTIRVDQVLYKEIFKNEFDLLKSKRQLENLETNYNIKPIYPKK